MKKVIYTAITNDYDTLKNPTTMTKDWDYVCFSDRVINSDIWQVRPTLKSDAKEARKVKVDISDLNYDLSIWHDASFQIRCNLDEFINYYHRKELSIIDHPGRDCIYEEAEACIGLEKDRKELILDQMEAYEKEGYPTDNGLVATGIIIRTHTESVEKFGRIWWEEVKKWSKRDQLSFNYALWKHPLNVHLFKSDVWFREFYLNRHKNGGR